MLKVIILTNPAKYTYHTVISHMIQSTLQILEHQVSTLDISTFQYDYECINQITTFNTDVLITLDLAGFHIRTQAGEIALNMLPTKNLNLIWGHRPEYADFLNKKLSLSMLFYDATGINHQLNHLYPHLLYYKVPETINPKPSTKTEIIDNQEHFHALWIDFLNATLLQQ